LLNLVLQLLLISQQELLHQKVVVEVVLEMLVLVHKNQNHMLHLMVEVVVVP
jgi:hypothetical protein